MFHAGAVEIDGRAVGFLGNNGAGKSTLASIFVGDGAALVTDDVLAVACDGDRYEAWPSYPSMRMWPDTACLVGVDCGPLIKVHPAREKRYVPIGTGVFGTFNSLPLPLERIYVLGERCGGSRAKIESAMIGESVYQLALNSFAGRRLHHLGATAKRFNALAALASKGVVRRLSVPEGVAHFGSVRDCIERDLAG